MIITATMQYQGTHATLILSEDGTPLSTTTVQSDGLFTMTERTFQEILTVENLRILLIESDTFNAVCRRRYGLTSGIMSDHTLEIEKTAPQIILKLKLGAAIVENTWSAPIGVTMKVRPALSGSWADWLMFIEAHRQFYNLIKAVGG